jgi:hypothetical protein
VTWTETFLYMLAVGFVWGGTLIWLLWENIHHERKRRRDHLG